MNRRQFLRNTCLVASAVMFRAVGRASESGFPVVRVPPEKRRFKSPAVERTIERVQASIGNEPGCIKCHGDKRGPFTFEHAAVKMQGCAACHEPHGSANPRMLTRHEVRFVCLECHANVGATGAAKTGTLGGVPPAFHDLRSPRFQNCTICHIKVHGSNVDRTFER